MAPEYTYFDPEHKRTKAHNEASLDAFLRGELTSPDIEYDKLSSDDLPKEKDVLPAAVKASAAILEAALALDNAAKKQKNSERIEAGREFTGAGEEKYGDLDKRLFSEALAPELSLISTYEPKNTHAEMTKRKLEQLLGGLPESADETEAINYEKAIEGALEYLSPLLEVMPSSGKFTAEEAANYFTEGLRAMGLDAQGWTIEVSKSKSVFTTSSADKKIYIPENTIKTAKDIRRLAAHEIGIHASKKVKLDDDFEEGLGVAVEAIVSHPAKDEPMSIKRARKRYLHLGLALGLDGTPRNARQVFEITWRLEALSKSSKTGIITKEIEDSAKTATRSYIQNIFRGSDYKLPGVVYMRPKLYYEGFKSAVDYINKHSGDAQWLRSVLTDTDSKEIE